MQKSLFKIMLALILLLSICLPGRCEALSHRISTSVADFTLSKVSIDSVEFILPEIIGAENIGQYGKPKLPKKVLRFALPVGATEIQLGATSLSEPVFFNLDKQLAPETDPNSTCVINNPETSYGNSISLAYIGHVENFRNISKIVSVVISPLQETEHGVRLFEEIELYLSYSELFPQTNSISPDYTSSPLYNHDISFLKSIVVNPENVEDMTIADTSAYSLTAPTRPIPVSNDAYEYTIVTNEELAPEFLRLVSLKKIQGYDAGITTMEYIMGCGKYNKGDTISSICDSAAILRAYLLDNKDVIKYVFLGGKPPIVPIRYGYSTNYDEIEHYIPTDLYFANEDNNWDIKGDNIYGQYYSGFNYSTIFKIGRLLCTTREEVKNYIDKLEIYELAPGFGDSGYLATGYGHISTDISSKMSNSQISTLQELLSDNFSMTLLTHGSSNPMRGQQVLDQMNNNYSFYVIHGHGNPEGIGTIDPQEKPTYGINALDEERLWQLEESGNGLDNLTNFGYPGVMLTGSCGTMPYDSPSYYRNGKYFPEADNLTYNIAESFTLGKNYGGVAYIGNTRALLISSATKMSTEFLNLLQSYDFDISIGELLEYTNIKRGAGYPHTDILGHGIIGDPSIHLWNGKSIVKPSVQPSSISRNYTDSIIVVTQTADDKYSSAYDCLTILDPGSGKIRVAHAVDSKTTFNHVNPNSIVYMSGSNTIPYIGNLDIAGNYEFNNPGHIYVNEANIGEYNPRYDVSSKKVYFSPGNILTIDARKNVTLNNVVIGDSRKSSYLIIMTPDTCFINSPLINSHSKIIVYAGNYVFDSGATTLLSDSKIETHPYDRYGIELYSRDKANIKGKSSDTDYMPLIEEGKTWCYSMVNWDVLKYPDQFKPDTPVELTRKLKAEQPEEIDGKLYYHMNVYYGEDETPASSNPMAYISEDPASHMVWFKANESFDDEYSWMQICLTSLEHSFDGVLYDFGTGESLGYVSVNEEMLECNDGWHRSLKLDNDLLYLVEGIGLMVTDPEDMTGCDMFGLGGNCDMSTIRHRHSPFLYEVRSASGDVIYANDNRRPGWWRSQTGIEDGLFSSGIVVTEMAIEIPEAGYLDYTLYDIQGRVVARETGDGKHLSIDISHLAKGVYLLSYAGGSIKIHK